MAKIKQGILGGFSGSVASVTGSSWKGIAVMKSKPLSVANPNTEAQQAQRASFKGIAVLASIILTYVIQYVYNPLAQYMSGYNLFCKQNKAAYDSTGTFVPANCLIGGGKLPKITDVDIAGLLGSTGVNLTFESNVIPGGLRDTDLIKGFALVDGKDCILAVTADSTRGSGTVQMEIISGADTLAEDDVLQVFLTPVSADGRSVGVAVSGTEIVAV